MTTVQSVLPADITRILVVRTGVDPDTLTGRDDTPLIDLDVDSLAVLELQAAVTGEYGVELPETTIELSLNGIAAYVTERMAGGGAR